MSRKRYDPPICNECMWFGTVIYPEVDACPRHEKDPNAPACKKDFMRNDYSKLNHNKHGSGYPKISAGFKEK